MFNSQTDEYEYFLNMIIIRCKRKNKAIGLIRFIIYSNRLFYYHFRLKYFICD